MAGAAAREDRAAQRQSVDFANFAAMLRQRTAGAIRVEVVNAGRTQPVAYPEQGEKTTAGAWLWRRIFSRTANASRSGRSGSRSTRCT